MDDQIEDMQVEPYDPQYIQKNCTPIVISSNHSVDMQTKEMYQKTANMTQYARMTQLKITPNGSGIIPGIQQGITPSIAPGAKSIAANPLDLAMALPNALSTRKRTK